MTSAVGGDDPALARQTGSRVTRGFLFADLRGYTAFIEANGDAAAGRLLDEYRRTVRAVVSEYGGAEIKTEGDSFYVVFSSATEAVSCGIAIVNAAAVATKDHADLPIKVAIGVHAGETADTEGGFVGSAVNMAARLCSVAAAGEVLVSDTVRGLTRTGGDFRYIPRGRRRLKGIAEPIPVFAAVDASGGSIGRVRGSRFGVGRRGAAIAAVLVATLVIAGVLVSPNLTAMLSTANSSPTPTVGVSPSSRPVPTASARTTPTTSTAPSPVAISELQLGKADPGRYRASFFTTSQSSSCRRRLDHRDMPKQWARPLRKRPQQRLRPEPAPIQAFWPAAKPVGPISPGGFSKRTLRYRRTAHNIPE